jgi:hypothetical protein
VDDWLLMAARPGNRAIARIETVKFVIDRHRDLHTHFFDSKRFEMHFDYVVEAIDPRAVFDVFNREQYMREDRRFVMGSVFHYLDGDHWTVELSVGDTLSADGVCWLYEHLAPRLGVADDLRYRPASPAQAVNTAHVTTIPMLDREAVNASVRYQPVVTGVAFGHLRLMRGPLDVAAVRPSDIVVLDHVPEEIPPVAALVTSELQAPLAHVAVLCRNRNTPDMALRDAIDDSRLVAAADQLVRLTVEGGDFRVEPASPAEAEASWAAMRPANVMRLHADLGAVGLFDVQSLPPDAAACVGAKSAQLGVLSSVDGVATPGGFCVPFSAYHRHLVDSGALSIIDEALDDAVFAEVSAERASRLAAVRVTICGHPVDAGLLADVAAAVQRLGPGRPLIFRSSTNAEDLDGFNGAGLYDSLPVVADPTEADIARALTGVWASVWLQRAFEEREWYRIDHRQVAMAVLVQPFVDDAVFTGVAITANPFNEGIRGVYLNVQVAGTTVTGAVANEIPEQQLVTTWSKPYTPELIGHSSLAGGRLLLAEDEAVTLTESLMTIHERMLPADGVSNAMDVEFCRTGDGRTVFVQARPYRVVYGADRASRVQRHPRWAAIRARVRRVVARLRPSATGATT